MIKYCKNESFYQCSEENKDMHDFDIFFFEVRILNIINKKNYINIQI